MGERIFDKVETLIRRGNRRRLRILLRKHRYLLTSNEDSLIFTAIWRNRGMLSWLCSAGVAPDCGLGEDGNTPLMQAAADGDIYSMRVLLRYGANVEATNEDGETPLGFATTWEQPDAIRLLVSHGADVNGTEGTDKTYLDWAVLSGWAETAAVLRELGGQESGAN